MSHYLLTFLVVAMLALAPAVQAQTCNNRVTATTPTSDFTIHGDGTATHNRTGLMWQRCSEGQTESHGGCSGSASTFTWQQALQRAAAVNAGTAGARHGYSDWRLPNKNELESIVEESCYGPAINATVFPNSLTGSSNFWSSSPYAYSSGYAWYVYFDDGYVNGYGKDYSLGVRLVRGGQSLGFLGGPRIAQTPMQGPPGTTFAEWGTGFTANSTVTLHFRNHLGQEQTPLQKSTDWQGAFSLNYTAPLDKPLGTHTWWAVDDTTGRMSDPVGYLISGGGGIVNALPAKPPTIILPEVEKRNDFGELTSEGTFDPAKETFVIVHGWNSTDDATSLPGWTTLMGGAIVGKGYNVLYWNWQEKAKTKRSGIGGMIYDYTDDSSCNDMWMPDKQSPWTKNEIPYDETENSGKYLATALLSGLPTSYNQDIHFIGHSLGTLVSTYAAKVAKGFNRPYASRIKHLVFLDSPCYGGVPGGSFLKDNSSIFLENYISIFGRSYKDADVNVWLPKAKDWFIDAHSYPYYWYMSSVNNFSDNILGDSSTPSSTMPWGFYWRTETHQGAAKEEYAQRLEEPHYQLFAGPPAAGDSNPNGTVVAIGGIAEALKQVITNQLTDFTESTGTKVTVLSLKIYDTAADIVGYAADVAGHALQEVVDLKGHLTLTHSSTAVLSMPVEIPANANQLAFGMEFLYSPPATLLEVFINDQPVYHTTSDLALGEGYQLVPWINVEQFAGQSVTLSLRLSNPNSDTEGKILIDDLVVARVEPGEVASDTDSDQDGLTDQEEAALGTNPAMADSDGDGYADGWEVTAGSDPLAPTSRPRPTVTGATPSKDTTPTWRWTSTGGNGTFRCRLDSGTWVRRKAPTFTPATPLAPGIHTLVVQERNAAGKWSLSGRKNITIDTTPPSAPVVNAATPTQDTTPTWTWTRGGGGNNTFRYRLDATGGWITTTAKRFTPATPLATGPHTLVVQERDAAGNWSTNGKKVVRIDSL